MSSSKSGYGAPGHGGATAYLAPGARAEPLYLPGAMTPRPSSSVLRIDDRAVTPETGFELLDGKLVALPASQPHGICHMTLDYVLKAHVAPGYLGATDLLTRTSEHWDFAADACIYKQGIDPATGSRYLEELAFEVKYTQKPSMLIERARQLSQAGVRRIFAIWVQERNQGGKQVVEAGPVKEWDNKADTWRELDPDSEIQDVCLSRPLKVRALLSVVEADNAVARALLARNNPVLTEREAEAFKAGQAAVIEAAVKMLLLVCRSHGIEVTKERMAVLEAMSAEELVRVGELIAAQACWPEDVS